LQGRYQQKANCHLARRRFSSFHAFKETFTLYNSDNLNKRPRLHKGKTHLPKSFLNALFRSFSTKVKFDRLTAKHAPELSVGKREKKIQQQQCYNNVGLPFIGAVSEVLFRMNV
jgi:hypothetical protein